MAIAVDATNGVNQGPDVEAVAGVAPGRSGPLERLADRKWAAIAAAVLVVVGMAFMLGWGPVIHHAPLWSTGGDLWGIFRGAHYVGWGYVGGVYTSSNGVLAFPGMEVLLAPVAMLSGSLHLTESYVPYFVNRPTAALILQPIELLLAGSVIFATDALAERLGTPGRRRICLCFVVAALAWPVAAIWGHAEDVVATTFALYAMIALIDRKWSRCGWLLGLGIVMQPLVLLLLPLFVGATPAGQRTMLAVRSTSLSVALMTIAFIGNPSGTWSAVVKQATPLGVNHPTPWAALAPTVSKGLVASPISIQHHDGRLKLIQTAGHPHMETLVSGGSGRIVDVVLAILVGLYVWRRPQDPVRLLWLFALVLASRCFFEPVMTPYYLAPPLILIVVMSSRTDARRFLASVVIAAELTLYAYYRLSPWQWWLPIVGGLAVLVALCYPGQPISSSGGAGPDDTSIPDTLPPDLELGSPSLVLERAR